MTDMERIERRLSAVERAVVDSDHELDELTDLAALAEEVESMQQRLTNLEQRVAEIEGSLRGR